MIEVLMSRISGNFQFPSSTSQVKAVLIENADFTVEIIAVESEQLLQHNADFSCGEILPGLPCELFFADGSCFIPSATGFVPHKLKHKGWVAKLESHRLGILTALILVPATCAWLFFVGIPAFAKALVPYTPEPLAEFIDQQSLIAIDTMLSPSKLPATEQDKLRAEWSAAFKKLGPAVAQPRNIAFRDAEDIGPNAFALPGGTMIMTDQLANLLKDNPDASLAVMLHELGHVQHRHGLQMMASSASTAVIVAVLFNDLESVSEIIIGGASSLIQAKFSRGMETEADDFANQSLLKLNKSPQAFIDAMATLAKEHQGDTDKQEDSWTTYFSSHPEIKSRIESAKKLLNKANSTASAKPSPVSEEKSNDSKATDSNN